MNVTEVTDKIKELEFFKEREKAFVFNVPEKDSHFGTIAVEPRTFKDSGENEYILGGTYNLFVAHMYPNTKKEFFYLTLERPAKRRTYRHREFFDVEWNKIYASGKTVDSILWDLKKQLDSYELF